MTPDYPLMLNQLQQAKVELVTIEEKTGINILKSSKIKNEMWAIPTTWIDLDIDDEMIQAVLLCILYKLTFNNRALPDLHKPWN